ncbi:MAG: hypothetical protein ACJAUW_002169, partial [Yoonia sp.]
SNRIPDHTSTQAHRVSLHLTPLDLRNSVWLYGVASSISSFQLLSNLL